MFKLIMVPVDLAHAEKLETAISTAIDLARHYRARLTIVAVTPPSPTSVAHNPQEFAGKLQEFADSRGQEAGIEIASKSIISHDPSIDLDDTLVKAGNEMGADLIVMSSHIPGLREHFWPSHGGRLASHARASVFLVRAEQK